MPITIGSNIQSLTALRHLSRAGDELSNVFEKLSSGQRINRASDDAAGLAVSSKLDLNQVVFDRGLRNLSEGTSLISITESALNELQNILLRQSELAQQSANGVLNQSQRQALHDEAEALRLEYNRIIATTSFNDQNLLDGSKTDLTLQAGFGTETQLDLTLFEEQEFIALQAQEINVNHDFHGNPFFQDTQFLVIPGVFNGWDTGKNDVLIAFNLVESGNHNLTLEVWSYMVNGNGELALVDQVNHDTGIETSDFLSQNGSASYTAWVEDPDLVYLQFTWNHDSIAGTTVDLWFDIEQDGMMNDLNVGATYGPVAPISGLPSTVTGDFTGLGQTEMISSVGQGFESFTAELASQEFGIQNLEQTSFSLLTSELALVALDSFKDQAEEIQDFRSNLGAYQSRIETASRVLQVLSEQSGAASSRIKDADMAAETAEFVRLSIIQEAAVSVLAQANLQPELALLLLSD